MTDARQIYFSALDNFPKVKLFVPFNPPKEKGRFGMAFPAGLQRLANERLRRSYK
jgi:hypothetical protein